jgi:hypothetical protein
MCDTLILFTLTTSAVENKWKQKRYRWEKNHRRGRIQNTHTETRNAYTVVGQNLSDGETLT